MNVAPGKTCGGIIGFANDGYWGMDVKQQTYTGSFWVKGAYEGTFTASFQSALTDDVFGSVEIESKAVSNEWVEHEIELTPEFDAPNTNNTFAITFDPTGAKDGSLDFNLISMFPPTYKGRKNGMRMDIAQALEDLHPVGIVVPHCYRCNQLTPSASRPSSASLVATCLRATALRRGGTGRTPSGR